MENNEYIRDAQNYRIREEARALIEETRRGRLRRDMCQVVGRVSERDSRQTLHTTGRKSILCRGKNNGQKTKSNPVVVAREVEVPGFPGVRVRRTGTAPYYINREPGKN